MIRRTDHTVRRHNTILARLFLPFQGLGRVNSQHLSARAATAASLISQDQTSGPAGSAVVGGGGAGGGASHHHHHTALHHKLSASSNNMEMAELYRYSEFP